MKEDLKAEFLDYRMKTLDVFLCEEDKEKQTEHISLMATGDFEVDEWIAFAEFIM